MAKQELRLIPHLTVSDAKGAIEFYKQAFGAEEMYCLPTPDGKAILHAAMKIGNSMFFLNDEFPDMCVQSPLAFNGSPITIHLQVDDADTWFNRAVNAGAKVRMPLENAFWGDRYGQLVDPFGHNWSIACTIENLSSEEITQRLALEFASN